MKITNLEKTCQSQLSSTPVQVTNLVTLRQARPLVPLICQLIAANHIVRFDGRHRALRIGGEQLLLATGSEGRKVGLYAGCPGQMYSHVLLNFSYINVTFPSMSYSSIVNEMTPG